MSTTLCRYCEIELDEVVDHDWCADAKECSRRVARRAGKTMRSMVTKPYVGDFDPVRAYNEAAKEGRA